MTNVEEQLKRRLDLLEDQLNAAGVGACRYGLDGRVLSIDRGAMRLLGFESVVADAADAAGRDLSGLLARAGVSEEQRLAVAPRIEQRGRVVRITPRGEPRCLAVDAFALRDAETGAEAMQVIIRDITGVAERPCGELAARFSLAALLGNLPGMIYRCDTTPERAMQFVSEGCRELTGYQPADLLPGGRVRYMSLVHPDDREALRARMQEKVPAGEPFQALYRLRAADGREKHVREHGRGILAPDGTLAAVEGFISDVTERAEAVEQLRRERDFVSAVIDIAGVLVVVLDPDGRIVRFNRACEQTTGYTFDEVKGKALWDFLLLPEEVAGVKEVAQGLRSGNFPSRHENYWVTRSGERRLIVWSNTALARSDGTVEYLVGTGLDVTERRRAEEELRKSEERYRELFEFAHDLIFTVDATNGLITTINSAARDVLSYDPAELIDKPYTTFVNAADLPAVEQHTATALLGLPTSVEAWCTRKDGTPVLLDFRMRAMVVGGEEGVIHIIAYDITERRRESEVAKRLSLVLQQRVREKTAGLEEANRHLRDIQAQLIQAEKLSALGQLAAGVSHEINNPLSFVSNNLVVLRRDFESVIGILTRYRQSLQQQDPEGKRRLLQEAEGLAEATNVDYVTQNLGLVFDRTIEGAERIRKIIRDMLDFARLGEAEWKAADINRSIDATLSILAHDIKSKNVQLVRDYEDVPSIFCMPGRLNQVFLNIIFNAVQAVSEGGRIVISTRADEGHVRVAVADNGPGIPKENLTKIFDPFFTTKPRGSGLGLSISYSIVADHGGRIDVESTVGAGSTFTVVLPLRRREPARG